jgi:hypothetical protein
VTPGQPILVRQNRAPARPAEVVDMRSDRKVRVRYTDERGGTEVVLVERCSEPREGPVRRVPAGARCSVAGCERMRGYYLTECYEHAGPDPYAEDRVDDALALRAVPKPPKPMRDAAYLAWVRREMCCACNASGPNEAHHFGPRGMSQKADDYHAVPLCTRCHRMFHDTGRVPGRDRAATEEQFAFVKRQQLLTWLYGMTNDYGSAVDALIEAIRREKEER